MSLRGYKVQKKTKAFKQSFSVYLRVGGFVMTIPSCKRQFSSHAWEMLQEKIFLCHQVQFPFLKPANIKSYLPKSSNTILKLLVLLTLLSGNNLIIWRFINFISDFEVFFLLCSCSSLLSKHFFFFFFKKTFFLCFPWNLKNCVSLFIVRLYMKHVVWLHRFTLKIFFE